MIITIQHDVKSIVFGIALDLETKKLVVGFIYWSLIIKLL